MLALSLAACLGGGPAVVRIDYMSDEIRARYDSFTEYAPEGDGSGTQAVIWTDKALRDFQLFEVDYDLGDDEIYFFTKQILCRFDLLPPEQPFTARLPDPETIPTHGISYYDEAYGDIRYFTIGWSGEDNSLLLTEFTV